MRLKLTLEYDGSRFRGWAAQPSLRTVEGVVRDALGWVYESWGRLAVAGRTDTGVQAGGAGAEHGAAGRRLRGRRGGGGARFPRAPLGRRAELSLPDLAPADSVAV